MMESLVDSVQELTLKSSRNGQASRPIDIGVAEDITGEAIGGLDVRDVP